MAFCRRHGIQVPGDLAVSGFDGFPAPLGLPFRLTTVFAPWEASAFTAVSLVAAMTKGETVPSETVLPVALVPGDTA